MSQQRRNSLIYILEVVTLGCIMAFSFLALIGASVISAQATTAGEKIVALQSDVNRLDNQDHAIVERVKALEHQQELTITKIEALTDLASRTQGVLYALSILSGVVGLAVFARAVLFKRDN